MQVTLCTALPLLLASGPHDGADHRRQEARLNVERYELLRGYAAGAAPAPAHVHRH
jgi:hypothetical protein